MTPEQDAEFNSLLSEFGNEYDKQAVNETVGTSYDADPQSVRISLVDYVNSLLAAKDAEIARLKSAIMATPWYDLSTDFLCLKYIGELQEMVQRDSKGT